MSKIQVFIDGQEGTTGLQLRDRLLKRDDIALIEIDPAKRKDEKERATLLNQADVAFLCLPDAAAKEAAALVTNPSVIVIDASTAHRVAEGWVYGLPELSPAQKTLIQGAKRIANCGCYAAGFLCAVSPLTQAGLLPKDSHLSLHAVSGYSGAGKKGIAQYEDENRAPEFDTPRLYALTLAHKHLPEMQKYAYLTRKPLMNPYVCDYYAGMTVCVPLFLDALSCKKADIEEALKAHYASCRFISVESAPASGFLPANGNVGTNRLTVTVCGNDEQVTVVSTLDNLGKGASGTAVQNMNLALGLDEGKGLS